MTGKGRELAHMMKVDILGLQDTGWKQGQGRVKEECVNTVVKAKRMSKS